MEPPIKMLKIDKAIPQIAKNGFVKRTFITFIFKSFIPKCTNRISGNQRKPELSFRIQKYIYPYIL